MMGNGRAVNGQDGGVVYADTVEHVFQEDAVFNPGELAEAPATQLQVIATAKFHTLTGNVAGLADETEGSAVEVPAGQVIVGRFTVMQLHSGAVLAYRKAN